MKRFIVALTVLFLAVNLTGCDAIQKKFTRKKKATVKAPRFYQLKKYPRKPPAELYNKHYAYWESWQSELINFIGENHKKDMRSVQEAIGNLKDLQNLLVPSKAEELDVHIERMEGAREIIFRGELSFANKDYVRGIADREDRAIKRDFCFTRIKNSLRKNMDEEETSPKLTMAARGEAPVEQQK
jgi:hypothetical protein